MIRFEQNRRGIVAAGTWTEDRIKLVDHWPGEEQLAEIFSTTIQGGGCGHNLGVDLRRMDSSMPVSAIGLFGNDSAGDYLFGQAEACGINTAGIHRTSQNDTSFTDVISDVQSGKRTFFHHRGTSDLLSPAHFDFSGSNERILHLGLLGLHKIMDEPWEQEPNGWVAVLKAAKRAGLVCNLELVSIDPQRIRVVARPCLPFLDTLVVNEFELAALANCSVLNTANSVDPDLLLQAARQVLSFSESLSLLVVHHPDGALALSRETPDQSIDAVQTMSRGSFSLPSESVKGAVGAGDAFAAGILYGVHQEWPLNDTLELAHAVAATSLRAADTVSAVESVDNCLAFARQYPTKPVDR